jgi:hypothetical protein
MSVPEFMADGTCASGKYDPDLWFPGASQAQRAVKAKKICNTECPVRDACLEYAVTFPVVLQGVWGGKSRHEIQQLRLARGLTVQHEDVFSGLPRSDEASAKTVPVHCKQNVYSADTPASGRSHADTEVSATPSP